MRPKLWLKPILNLFFLTPTCTETLKKTKISKLKYHTLSSSNNKHHYHRHGDDNGVDDLDSTDRVRLSLDCWWWEKYLSTVVVLLVYNELGGHSRHIKTFPLYRYHGHDMWAIQEENKAMYGHQPTPLAKNLSVEVGILVWDSDFRGK